MLSRAGANPLALCTCEEKAIGRWTAMPRKIPARKAEYSLTQNVAFSTLIQDITSPVNSWGIVGTFWLSAGKMSNFSMSDCTCRNLPRERSQPAGVLLHTLQSFRFKFCLAVLVGAFSWICSAQENTPIRGLWVWKGPSIAADAHAIEKLSDFCRSQNINEVYISVSSHGEMLLGDFPDLIAVLHRSHIRIEALLASEDADLPGQHRDKLLGEAREIVGYDKGHPKRSFDGIHLDIEPQQRPENKGAGNLRFLAGLVDAYRAVRQIAEPAQLTVNADIQNKLLKGDIGQRKLLLSSLPRLTLMLYEVSRANDGESVQKKTETIQAVSGKFLETAYAGLHGGGLAKMVIGLRTPDYQQLLPDMLTAVEAANDTNPHYAGWAWHSYNDSLKNTE
jgi:hypothetical protein